MSTTIVMFSGGIGSWAAAKRIAEQRGTKGMILLFADVKGEDEDTYRFIPEAAANIGAELVTICDGRTIWEVFAEKRYLGNAKIAPCSHELKQKPARAWLDANCDPTDTTVAVGIDWTEIHRLPAIERSYQPFNAIAPLTEPPYMDKRMMLDWARREGLMLPRLYAMGFPHNNCGGGCVRAGQAQFQKLLEVMPERFDEWAERESEIRSQLGKDVSILRDRTNGSTRPLPLVEFRERNGRDVDPFDFGGCGCLLYGGEQ